MDRLEYSNDALSAKGLFYNKTKTVYVEGKDDPLFWERMFEIAEVSAHIEDVGGKEELQKYIDKIFLEDALFYIATDNDNSEFLDHTIDHPRIIRTYGYSIENSMYFHHKQIEKTITNFSRVKTDIKDNYNEWITNFTEYCYDLIIYDIANNKFKKGVSIFGDNCCRFLVNSNSEYICTNKIQNYIDNIKNNFTVHEIKLIKDIVHENEKNNWFLIKGHFISHALINYIKNSIKKITQLHTPTITLEYLYSITIDCFDNWEEKLDLKNVIERIRLIDK